MSIRNGNLTTIHTTALEARKSFVDVVTDQTGVTFYPNGKVGIVGEASADFGPSSNVATPTRKAHRQLAGRANVPAAYYDRILGGHGDLWVHTMTELTADTTPALYRMIVDGPTATLRAALSDRYQVIDNVDILTTLLRAFTESGLGDSDLEVRGDFDAADGALRLRVVVPAIGINARDLVAKYRSPFDRRTGEELPMIFAGIEVANSETGNGAYSIKPRVELQVCRNGMVRDVAGEQFRRVHLGARLESGVIAWSEETRQRQLELVASAARDAITTFISPEYLRRVVDEASAAAGVEVASVESAMRSVVTTASLSDDEASAVLDAFMRSGDTSVLGLAHAVTAAAQDVTDGERQSEMEAAFWSIVNAADAHAGA